MLQALNFTMNKRRFKKALRSLEIDLGGALKQKNLDLSSPEFIGRLDFWISYYVTTLLRATREPDELWCDGSRWVDGHHVLDFSKLREYKYSLKCLLDLQDDESTYNGELNFTFEYNNEFQRFLNFRASLLVENREYVYSSYSIQI
ncbi:hypothetical protein [Oceanisphaera pacifica]|uniref:Uncharacterized protein n=1 Tax=Oceanisphaera pacifica TaxID=2818389 RepID=A0ABS3NE38_9GAMM|nr:hypothetical protein [Oceanisphaera pacifica]MBO1518809.1 hypothetical protein [Oceanisphaera pacifica]